MIDMVSPGGNCFNCGLLQASDRFCFGCGTFVCDNCEIWAPFGRHCKDDHINLPEVNLEE